MDVKNIRRARRRRRRLCGQLLEGALGGFWARSRDAGLRLHRFKVARSIGWPTGHRFQNEIAWMNAGICTVMLHGFYSGMLWRPGRSLGRRRGGRPHSRHDLI